MYLKSNIMLITCIIIASLIGILLLTSSRPPSGWKESTVKAGRHDFDFDAFTGYRRKGKIRVHGRFTECSTYSLCCGDQLDWNKAPGLMTSLHPHVSSALVGWRWNGDRQQFEFSYYVHNADTSTQHMGGGAAMRVGINAPWWYEIEDDGMDWLYTFSNGNSYRLPKAKTKGRYKISGWWFGGNQAAPNDVSVHWFIE